MRRILIALAMLLFFTVNQAAQAFEQCEDPACMTQMDSHEKSDGGTMEPCCLTHCAMSGHHAMAIPQADIQIGSVIGGPDARQWADLLIPDSITLESLIEPPSLV